MMRASSAALMPLAEALDRLRALAGPVAPQAVPLAEAHGRIAAVALVVPHARPLERRALRDGFAVDAAAIGGASPYAPMMLSRAPPWVEAGDRMPPDTDAVLPAEGLEGRSAVSDVGTGEGVRAVGEDFSRGESVLPAGARIGPGHLLALASLGWSDVDIRRPRLRLVVTGAPEPDALSPMLSALIEGAGGCAATVAVPDDPEAITGAIRMEGADAVFVLGGTGFGRTDRSADGLAQAGRVLAHGLALRPGETAGFGEAGERPVLLLPGRPDAALAVLLALGVPLLAMLTGATEPTVRRVPLSRKIVSAVGLAEIVFVRFGADGIEPLGGIDLPLGRLARADGAVLVPPEREGYPEGTQVEVMPL